MSQNSTENIIPTKKGIVAELLAADELTDEEIAKRVGVSRQTINRWKKLPVIQQLITDARVAVTEVIREEGIRNKLTRLTAYETQHEQIEQIRRERAEDAANPASKLYGIPGATTGWVTASLKLVTFKSEAEGNVWKEESWEFPTDLGLMREVNNLRKQVAQEVGQWTEKQEVDMTNVVEIVGFNPDAV